MNRTCKSGLGLAIGLVLSVGTLCGAQTPPPAPSSPAAAEDKKRTLSVVVPQEGEYFATFVASVDGKEKAQLPTRFLDKKASLSYDPAGLGKSARISVFDAKSGNVAIVALPANDVLELRRSDFDHVRRVEVKVTHESKPVQAAIVSLKAGTSPEVSETIDATKQGVAVFEDVMAGKAKLNVKYGDNFTQSQDVEISVDHPSSGVVLSVAVTNKVPTLEANAPAAAGAGPGASTQVAPPPGATTTTQPATPQGVLQPPAPAPGSPLMALLGQILGLGVVAGIIYGLYKWAGSGGMAETLKKIGIETSGPQVPAGGPTAPWQPQSAPPPVVADPSLCPFCGQKLDVGGGCACNLTGGGGGAAVGGGFASPVGAGVATQPRLVGTMGVYSGNIFPLNGVATVVGRDATNGIPLPNDTNVSRRHASLQVDPSGACMVTDEGSTNGVYVNGVRISGSQVLRPGDEVQIGNTRFRYEV